MAWSIDFAMHSGRAAEACRRIGAAAALDESAMSRTDGEAGLILDGARALLWLDGGIRRRTSDTLLAALIADFGEPVVLRAAVEACRIRPPGPVAWIRRACRQTYSKQPPRSC